MILHEAKLLSRSPYRLKLTIPGMPPMNTQATRQNLYEQSKQVRRIRDTVLLMVNRTIRPLKPIAHARVTMIRHSSVQGDDENLRLSFKPYLDALTLSGLNSRKRWISRADVLEDDGPKHVERHYGWEKAPPGHGFITIEVEEIPCST